MARKRKAHICSVEECQGRHEARGFCNKHYQRWLKFGDPLTNLARVAGECSVDGCSKKAVVRKLCPMHYRRLRIHGNVDTVKKRPVRSVIIDGETVRIPLTQEKFAIVDIADLPLIEGRNWSARVKPGDSTAYAVASISRGDGSRAIMSMHALIMGASGIDHINGNGLDNRRGNLRRISGNGNYFNMKLSTRNRSGFKGVCWSPRRKMWRAAIGQHGRQFLLGHFKDIEAAARAYDKAAVELFGEFAKTNKALGLLK